MTSVPCGKCAFCIKKAIDSWCVRLGHELEYSSSAFFLTLTYNDEHLPKNAELSKRDLQLFFKRLRKRNSGIRYFAIGEYGTEMGRPHYHAVIFNLLDLELVTESWKDEKGPIGHIKGDRATPGRIRYMVSYMATPVAENGKIKPFRIMSRNPGIGNRWLVSKAAHFHKARSDSVVYNFDTPNAMPRYYLDKLYTPGQRRYIHMQRVKFTLDNPQPDPCPVQHEWLLKKLNRKQR